MKSKTNSKVIKRPKSLTSQKRKRKGQLAARRKNNAEDMTPTLRLKQKKINEKNRSKSLITKLAATKRQNWVDLNKKQTDFLSNAANAAISFAISKTETESAGKFEMQNTVLNATRSILMQKAKKVKVPPTKSSRTKTNPISKAMYINISENMDATIHSLTEVIKNEERLLKEKAKLLKRK